MMIMIVGPNPGRACKVLKQGVEMCHSFGFEEKGCLTEKIFIMLSKTSRYTT